MSLLATDAKTCGSSGVVCAPGETCCGNKKCFKLTANQKCCPEGCDKCDFGDVCAVGCGETRQCGTNSCCDTAENAWCGGANAHCNLSPTRPICASDRFGAKCVGGIPCAASQKCANGFTCDGNYCKCGGSGCPTKNDVCLTTGVDDDGSLIQTCCTPNPCPRNTCGFNGCKNCTCLPGYTCMNGGKCVNFKLIGYLIALGLVFLTVTAGGLYLIVRWKRTVTPAAATTPP